MISRALRGQTVARTAALPMIVCLVAANLLVWAWAWHAFHDRPALLSTALLAWIFGLRHAVDADHIAAIDNVVRKLVRTNRGAWDCGLFFALGHSSVVILMCAAIVWLPSIDGIERVRDAASAWGTIVSAGFLLLIALANLGTLRRLQRNGTVEHQPPGGAMHWILRPVQRLATRGWHMLPVGFLFGLGFDTATEVALLALTARQSAAGLFAVDVFIFPALFAAGMILIDTADSALMTRAYRWASHDPLRDLTYNIAITTLSVFVAFGVGGLEIMGLLADHLPGLERMTGVAWLLSALPWLGFVIAGGLLSVWAIAALSARPERMAAD